MTRCPIPDTVFKNGHVHTVDRSQRVAQAVAVTMGRSASSGRTPADDGLLTLRVNQDLNAGIVRGQSDPAVVFTIASVLPEMLLNGVHSNV